MSLTKIYAAQFREHLRLQPVWQPGSAIEPGDIGVMDRGVFVRQGHIAQFADVPLRLVETPIPGDQKFAVGVSLSLDLGGNATIDPSLVVGATLKIDRAGGVAYHAHDLFKRTIDNLRQVLAAVPWESDLWPDGTVFVAEVTDAARVTLVLTEATGSEIKVTGKAGPLQMLELADASIGIGLASNASFTLALPNRGAAPGRYPVALGLYGRRRNWIGMPRIEPLEAADTPLFVELAPGEDSPVDA